MSVIEWRCDRRRIVLSILILKPAPTSDLTHYEVSALLDTGANVSGVATHIAKTLDLPGIGRRPLMSAQGLGQAKRFLFRVGLKQPGSDAATLPFIFEETMGFELIDGTNLDAVLGMDVLSQCDLELRRDGTCRLSFG
jgi:hypothetical protein